MGLKTGVRFLFRDRPHNMCLYYGMLQFTRLMIHQKVNRLSSLSEAAISRNSYF